MFNNYLGHVHMFSLCFLCSTWCVYKYVCNLGDPITTGKYAQLDSTRPNKNHQKMVRIIFQSQGAFFETEKELYKVGPEPIVLNGVMGPL